MYRLAGSKEEWKELFDGVSMQFAPPTRNMVTTARRAVRYWQEENPDADAGEANEVFSLSILEQAVLGWEGIGGPTGTKNLPFNKANLQSILNDANLFDAAQRVYVVPIMLRGDEKNVSAPSLNGTGARATAEKTIAGSPATATKKVAAKPARTKKTNRKPAKAK